ncbi:MAG: O-antigen ligase family protein [Gammaproteobacteria bacterium]
MAAVCLPEERVIIRLFLMMLSMTPMQLSRSDAVERVWSLVPCAALVAFPAIMLSLPTLANGCFSVLLLWSIATVIRDGRPGLECWAGMLRAHWPITLAMLGLPLAVALRQVTVLGAWPEVPYLYTRFALFVLLARGFVRMPPGLLRGVQWGFVAGAIVSAIWIHSAGAAGRPFHVGFSNVIPFGNLSLLMGMLALASIGWTPPGAWLQAALKVLAGAAGLYVSYMSQTRGSWIAIPVFAVIMLAAARKPGRSGKAGIFAASLAGLALVAYLSPMVNRRIVEAVNGVALFFEQNSPDSSEGVRLQLWQAALDMFRANPWSGVGSEGFAGALQALATQHVVTPTAAALTHAHNDILNALATLGAPGLLAILALYLVPFWYFLAQLHVNDRETRVAATLGVTTSAGFFTFGMTETMFINTPTNAFYSLVVSVCFALVVLRRQALAARR